MTDLFTFLEQLAPLSPGLQHHLQKITLLEEFPKKAHLLQAGSINRKVYFITKGLVRCYTKDSTGQEQNIWFLREGDVIAPTEGFNKQTITDEYIQALEPCTAYSITFSELENIYRLFPEFHLHGRRIAVQYSLLWYTLFKQIKMKSASERYLFLVENFPDLSRRVQNQHLATFLGIGMWTLSRLRRGQ
jgi:CRP/FNR family transcriptional regulator, anaerobic regulatory protein